MTRLTRLQHFASALTLTIVMFLCLSSSLSGALLVGAGENLSGATGREGVGQRLNIDDYHTQYLQAGTYTIEDFTFMARVQSGLDPAVSGGSVVPFLAIHDGSQYRLIWRGNQTDLPTHLTNNESAVVHGTTAGSFSLSSAATVYSGFFTYGNAAVAYAIGYPEPRTDHANTTTGNPYTWINTIGNAISGVTYSQQARSYAHGITVQATNDVRIGPGLTNFTNADSVGGERLNIDRSKTMTLSAGTHTITSFSFVSTLAVGGELQGTVTPFLAKQTSSDQWQILWIGDAVDNSILGGNEVSLSETLTLTEDTTLHAGFFTAGGARVAYTNITSGNGTAHQSGSSFSATEGQIYNFTSYSNLLRYYSFEIMVAAVPEPGRHLLLMTSLGLWLIRRHKRSR